MTGPDSAIAIISGVEARRRGLRPRAQTVYPPALLASLAETFGAGATPESVVEQILSSIRQQGEQAARRWSLELDGLDPQPLLLDANDLERAWREVPKELQQTLELAAERIRRFHERQPLPNWTTDEFGGTLGQRVTAVGRVGVYVPGGSAPLPSSLLMSVIPAQVAGVEQIVVATPPDPHPSILAAAHLCGLKEILQLGGAQAIGALAYGLADLAPVDKIVGAGGLFVTLAKKAVFGQVGIDGLAGPTETMILADGSANPDWLAADLLAQAEHDPLASAWLLTPDAQLAEQTQAAVDQRLAGLSRKAIIEQSLRHSGGIVVVEAMDEAVVLANEYAAEHLCLSVTDPVELAEQIENAGGLFLGDYSFEVLGDYVAGPSHIMPTGGTARYASPLSVLDFIKITTWVQLDRESGAKLAGPAARLADCEGLTAHAAAARARLEADDV